MKKSDIKIIIEKCKGFDKQNNELKGKLKIFEWITEWIKQILINKGWRNDEINKYMILNNWWKKSKNEKNLGEWMKNDERCWWVNEKHNWMKNYQWINSKIFLTKKWTNEKKNTRMN